MECREYLFGSTLVSYLIDDQKNVAMRLLPADLKDLQKSPWECEDFPFDPRAEYIFTWEQGTLAFFHLSHQQLDNPGLTMKSSRLARTLLFEDQSVTRLPETTRIVTTLKSEEGYKILHTLTWRKGLRGFEIDTEFVNESAEEVTLDMLSSFCLDGLSPFHMGDIPDIYRFHRFMGGWSLEGKHVSQSMEELGLEKSWVSWLFTDNSEKFGSFGSYPVERYFPTAVFEDTVNHVLWAAQLKCNTTWQMELTRVGDYMSFTGGLGDNDRCGWQKKVPAGASFCAPTAYVAVAKGDIHDACSAVTDMQKTDRIAYGEKGIPTSFNEYCATWGNPTQEKMLMFADTLKEFGIRYLVIDAGWCSAGQEQSGNGEWLPDPSIFPDMKEMNRLIREKGMIPGIWLEFEVTTEGSRLYGPEFDHMKLQRDSHVIKTYNRRSFWDFRREDVRKHLYGKVITFLREYGFGYIKVDYNDNIGMRADGGDSGAESLRAHLQGVREFFRLMKQELPDLIIENCASGGHRLEPSMMGVSGVSSFSDAHEAVEIPYIAADLHKLMLPSQELIWAVLHNDDSKKRLCYSLAATFLGRVCLSGRMDLLDASQRSVVKDAMDFYQKLTDVIENGDSRLFGNRGNSTRHPEGTQIVVRRTDEEILVVCHAFRNPGEEFVIDLNCDAEIAASFNQQNIKITGRLITVSPMEELSAEAVLLRVKKTN